MAREHRVREGDCISSIAFESGFFPDTVWKHPENAALRDKRADPNVLAPGDQVFVPDLRPSAAAGATGRRHCFRRLGVPEHLRLTLASYGKPRANARYRLEIDGAPRRGVTDAEGRIDVPIPPNARRAVLVVGEDRYELTLGGVDPLNEDAGTRHRLENLGYLTATVTDLAVAIARFQADHRLPSTGKLDDATRAELGEAHGS
jgi:Putative peptidoglycan binding domain